MYYHGARYYAPWLGRWTSCDPKGLDDGVNLYIYVGACPLSFVDPSGQAKKKPQAEIGDRKRYNQQGRAIREAGKRVSDTSILVPG